MTIESHSDMIRMNNIPDWEKEIILQVLKRNKVIVQRDERRVTQLAMRVQLKRMDDYTSPKDDCELKTKTGQWHRDLVYKRCGQTSADIHKTLYRRISSELASAGSQTLSSKADSEPCCSKSTSSKYSSDSRTLKENRRNEANGNMEYVKKWVDFHAVYSDSLSGEVTANGAANKNKEKKSQNLALNIKEDDISKQREI